MAESVWGGTGRPSAAESAQRRREFIRLLGSGLTWKTAAEQARISPKTVLTLLDAPEFRTVVAALLDGRVDMAAVTVAPGVEAQAA